MVAVPSLADLQRPGEASRHSYDIMNPPGGAGLGDDLSEDQLRTRRRYRLQRHASWLLKDMRRLAPLRPGATERKEAPYRVTTCLWALDYRHSGVTASKTVSGVTLRGLRLCGSIWHCPVCAARIANERRRELRLAVVTAEAMGYKTVLLTFTARHDRKTSLKEQLEAMTGAYAALWRGAPADRLKVRYGILGMIRSLEATHSRRNGWHPHIHVIVFVPQDTDIAGLASDLRARWEQCAARHGLSMNEHGFDLVDNTKKVADYIAKYGHEPKWREADELARWHTKVGCKRGQWEHFTPWQLLEFSEAGDVGAGALFREYAEVFHGRRQIVWSDGLRDTLGLGKELTDQEAAEKETDEPELLKVYLTWEQWRVVRGNDARVEMMELVARYDTPEVIQGGFLALFGFAPLVTVPGDDPPDLSDDPDG